GTGLEARPAGIVRGPSRPPASGPCSPITISSRTTGSGSLASAALRPGLLLARARPLAGRPPRTASRVGRLTPGGQDDGGRTLPPMVGLGPLAGHRRGARGRRRAPALPDGVGPYALRHRPVRPGRTARRVRSPAPRRR